MQVSAELLFFDVVVAFVGLKLPFDRLRMDVSSDSAMSFEKHKVALKQAHRMNDPHKTERL